MLAKSQKKAFSSVAKIAVAVPLYQTFDYLIPESYCNQALMPGLRVEVPFGKHRKIGFLIEIINQSTIEDSKLKAILTILDEHPLLSPQDIQLLLWASDYYHHPLGEVFSAAFPLKLRKEKSPQSKPLETYYALTDQGKQISCDHLKRSPKQQALIVYFQQIGQHALSRTELDLKYPAWRKAIKPLMDKNLLQQVDANELLPSHMTVTANLPIKTHQPAYPIPFLLNEEQQAAIDTVNKNLNKFSVFLLEGVTGSGKTEVYMQIIQTVLARGQQVLFLVPEISLTPQLESRFKQRFSVTMSVSHSGLSDTQRHIAWLNLQQGSSGILVGTRSVLFTPLKKPGLIILDEEHDTSFKQQEGFRFSARDVAIMRGKLLNIPVVLGSATPSLESLYNVSQQRYHPLVLSQRAGNAVEPTLHLLDIRNKRMVSGLSEALIAEIRIALNNNEQILLFLNRRGFAPTLICHSCGWVARCRNCDANMVIHNHNKLLRCHHCGRDEKLPVNCLACNANELMPLGLGTERIENALSELFPDKTLIRLDRDTTQRKGSLERYLSQINDGSADIILGTQMLAKGHHFPNVTLAAIIDVDSGLFSIDFRAAERLAQLIVQVSGRAGRAEKSGKVILQTRHPEHPLLNTLILEGYRHFSQIALAERKQAMLPPYSYHALFRAQAGIADKAIEFLNQIAKLTFAKKNASTQVLGPVSAPMEKRAGVYRYQLLLQSKNRKHLQALLTEIITQVNTNKPAAKVRWSLDVDPVDLF